MGKSRHQHNGFAQVLRILCYKADGYLPAFATCSLRCYNGLSTAVLDSWELCCLDPQCLVEACDNMLYTHVFKHKPVAVTHIARTLQVVATTTVHANYVAAPDCIRSELVRISPML